MTFYGVKSVIAWQLYQAGPGTVFTIEQLEHWVQSAMIQQGKPGKRVEVDRRLRELRDRGWVIRSHRDETALALNQYRLVQVGDHVWERANHE
jgi:hypothetical protein